MKDVLINGIAGGLAGGIFIGIVSPLLFILKICRQCLVVMGARLISTTPTGTLQQLIIGEVVNLGFSLFWGAVLAYLLYLFGTDRYPLKGMAFGVFVWLVDIVVLMPRLGLFPRSSTDLPSFFIIFGYHIVYGLIASLVITNISGSVFKPKTEGHR